jgi:SNF2 family DNA or RNA helicase
MTVTIGAGETSTADLSAYLPLLERLRNGARPQRDWSKIVDDAVQVWARPGFDTFLALPRLRFEPFDYQLRAARTVLRRMRGRGILADEVGLGKTIEAGLVLSELRMRGLADQVLVITPAGTCRPMARRTGAEVRVADHDRPIRVDTCPRGWDGPAGHYRLAGRRSPRSTAG